MIVSESEDYDEVSRDEVGYWCVLLKKG